MYILQCADDTLYVGTLYVGYTTDLNRRLFQHNNSKTGAHYTKIRRPVKMVYSESFRTLSKALKREAEIKGWKRNKKMELINLPARKPISQL